MLKYKQVSHAHIRNDWIKIQVSFIKMLSLGSIDIVHARFESSNCVMMIIDFPQYTYTVK